MRKIDKSPETILSTKYKAWLDKLKASVGEHPADYRYYYDDVVMNLYRCQKGVCAYTERHLCTPALYDAANWVNGRPKIPDEADYNRKDHSGEMDHFDPEDKKGRYWNWDNLFMIDAAINGLKSNKRVIHYLMPGLPDYSPEKYFDFDPETGKFYPNTDIENPDTINEIEYMIKEVLYLNHPQIKHIRDNYHKMLKFLKKDGKPIIVDEFFTSVKWALGEE